MSENKTDTDVVETETSVAQPLTIPAPVSVPLDKVAASIASDSLKNTKEYLKATVTPGGGE